MTQDVFVRHLAAGADYPPALIASPQPHQRFAVYRNNVIHGLMAALQTRFPATERLIGDESFRFCSQLFVEAHKPRSPLLMFYGDGFPDFLDQLPFLADWPFLSDFARIEVARTKAYHARDCEPFRLHDTGADIIAALMPCHFEPHPAVVILSSSFPAATIWALSDSSEALAQIDWQPQTMAITRGHYDIQIFIVPEGTAPCLAALQQGATLEEALVATSNAIAGCDLATLLVSLLRCDLLATPSLCSAAQKDI